MKFTGSVVIQRWPCQALSVCESCFIGDPESMSHEDFDKPSDTGNHIRGNSQE